MRAALLYRVRSFIDGHLMLIALMLVVVVAIGALFGIRWEAEQRDTKLEQEAIDRQDAVDTAATERRQQICAESRNLRALVSELIDTAVGMPRPALPLETVPSFAGLPPSVQTWVREVVAAAAALGDGPSLAARLRTFQETRLATLPEFCTVPFVPAPR